MEYGQLSRQMGIDASPRELMCRAIILLMTDVSHQRQPIALTPEMIAEIRGAWAEIDPAQMAIISRLSPAERMRRGFAMSNAVRRVAVYRLRQQRPELSEAEANRMVLAHYYEMEERFNARH